MSPASPLHISNMAKKASPAKKLMNFRRMVSFLQTKLNASNVPSPRILSTYFPPQVSILPRIPPQLSVSKQPSISTTTFSTFASQPNNWQVIPQLDGFTDGSKYLQNVRYYPNLDQETATIRKCDNCHKVFETEHQLELHDARNQFGCEDCSICFTSTFYADLQKLHKHPRSSYACDQILPSYSLPRDFNAGVNISQNSRRLRSGKVSWF